MMWELGDMYKIDSEYSMYFITSTIIEWVPLLINEQIMQIMIVSFVFCQKEKGLRIYGYVVMPNHFHMIISMDDPLKIPAIIRDLKRHTSQEISKYLKNQSTKQNPFWIKPFYGKKISNIWQKGYHPILINSEKWFTEKLNYIHQNPVKKGFVTQAEHWKYSSARNYILNDSSIIKLDLDKL